MKRTRVRRLLLPDKNAGSYNNGRKGIFELPFGDSINPRVWVFMQACRRSNDGSGLNEYTILAYPIKAGAGLRKITETQLWVATNQGHCLYMVRPKCVGECII